MRTRSYRLTVIGCALAWFLVGLHLPALHELVHHGAPAPWSVVAVVSLMRTLQS